MQLLDKDVDIVKLVKGYREKAPVRATIDYLASREREPRDRETRARALRNSIAKNGDFTVEDVVAVLDLFATSGCGELKVGRPKEETRLVWHTTVSALDTARSVQKIAVAGAHKQNGDVIPDDELYESHSFPVRPGVVMPLRLRKDLTSDELNNLAEFVKVVARARLSALP